MIQRIPIPSSSTEVVDEGILVTSANTHFSYDEKSSSIKPRLLLLNKDFEHFSVLSEFRGNRNCLLKSFRDVVFLGIDNKLFLSRNLKSWRKVLESECAANSFLHMTEITEDILFAQDYGINSMIYRSIDGGENWQKLVECTEIDKNSIHFHSIIYDQYRDLLMATLGDSNHVKIIVSDDLGETWKPVYSRAFQCLPIVASEHFVVFGMDSAISSGLIIWKPKEDKFESIHLKFEKKLRAKDLLQLSDLKLVGYNTWLMSTGKGSLLFSNDLRNWELLQLGKKEQEFDFHTISDARNGLVSVAMGNELVIIKTDELVVDNKRVDVKQRSAVLSRVLGFGYVAKRKLFRSA